MPEDPRAPPGGQGPWWRGLDRYMWWVLIASALGWLFDVMDQRIFTVSRNPALDELLSVKLDRSLLATLNAGEAARLLGVEAGPDPQAPVRLEPAGERTRARLVLPPLAPGAPERKLTMVFSREDPAEARVLPPPQSVLFFGRIATAVFLAGWATGGILFGILGDKWGRAFTMVLTILVYSLFTGLSALSVSWIDYSAYRFLTGMGVGGEFAAGAALVAEVMPPRARPYALGLLQAFSALGNILGSYVGSVVLPAADPAFQWDHWRLLYVVGILPAILVVIIRRRLKEPERWRAAKETSAGLIGKQLGAFGDLFHDRWRRSTFFGLAFAVSGVIGLWGIGFWTPELIGQVHGVTQEERSAIASRATLLQDVGAFLGISAVTLLTQGAPRSRIAPYVAGLLASLAAAGLTLGLGAGTLAAPVATAFLGVTLSASLYFAVALTGAFTGGLGRRASFAISFLAALVATIAVFRWLTEREQIYWMIPLLGFSTLLCFGLYAIYFPELYPTRLRTTGTGFCYNVARYVAAAGVFLLGYLGTRPGFDLRTSCQAFALIYLVGVVAAFYAPETKDRPLAED
jgi:MFS family permease